MSNNTIHELTIPSTLLRTGLTRRDFLRWMGIGTGAAVLTNGLPLRLLAAANPDENPLAGSIARDWEKIYRDQYKYDRSFDWVCSPNDTHACRVRAYVRNGIVTRLGATYDYQTYADLYGNKATANWNPRQCAKGYTFHRVIYGLYRLRHPIVRKGWKAWADAGFPELTPELKSQYLFDNRGQDEFIQISWEDALHDIAKALVAIATRYSGEEGKKRLLAQGYQPEMVEATKGAGTRCIKMRGGMGLLGVIGKYGMYRLNNSLAVLDAKIRGVDHEHALAGRNWSNYTWHGDQAPGHPWVHGLQTSECDFNDLRFSKLIIMDGKNLNRNT
ncbi:MAG: molybdopterin-dependent oxidoreductase [Deltaproteobacteria bacterium]|nr:molybdopterin-dependent oxidoreductase [Deltaproteobacteria bacterium]